MSFNCLKCYYILIIYNKDYFIAYLIEKMYLIKLENDFEIIKKN